MQCPDCHEREVDTAGYCSRCYRRHWRAQRGIVPKPVVRACSIEGCEEGGKFRRGLCGKHYTRLMVHGDPLHEAYPDAVPVGSVCRECDRPAVATGLCMRCYKRGWRLARGIEPLKRSIKPARVPRQPPAKECLVDGCDARPQGRGYCEKHYRRFRRHGDPLHVEGTERGTVAVESVIFNGIEFRRYPESKAVAHQRYYKPGGQWIKQGIQALHQEVWKSVHGLIPEGHHIHHLNGDWTDNRIENLECLPRRHHEVEHAETRSARGKSAEQQALLDRIRPLTVAWHQSPEGREWHREHARKIGFGSRVQPHDK